MPISKSIGARIKRREDPRLISGLAHYVDDVKLPDILHVAFVRSIYAHAKIKVDTKAAAQHPEVVAVITGEDILNKVGLIPVAADLPTLKVEKHYPLALGEVHYVGEPIAAVVATDRYIAKDAADLVNVDYDPLPVVMNPEQALKAPPIHEGLSDNIVLTWKLAGGDLEKTFKAADRVIKQRFINQRLAPVSMETRGVLAHYMPGENTLTVWASTQIPHLLRTQIAGLLGLQENLVRVIAPEVGGGFGSKLNVYAEDVVVPYLSVKLGRPVKWIESRRENLLATIHGRDQIDDVEVAVKNDGTILGLKCDILADLGAYHQLLTPLIPTLTGLVITGCYKIPAVSVELTGVFTNKMSTDAYRGAGRPEATYIIERIMDLVAAELGMSPVDIRLKNFPKPEEFPYTTSTGIIYDSGNYQESFKKALHLVQYHKIREEQKKLREQGRYLGIGISTYVEICGMGPSAAMPAGGWESGTLRVEPSGKVTVLTGSSPHGQGQETSFAQIVADELGVDVEDVVVVHGDTAVVPYGIGTFGSRATAVGGTAMLMATRKVKEKIAKIAAHLLEVSAEDLEFDYKKLYVKGSPDKSVPLGTVIQAAYLARNLPPDTEPGLQASHTFEPSNFTYPFGCHIAVVEVDPETGEIKFRKYVAVDDCGNVINPMLVDGQIQGGIAQGLAQAIYEEVVHDENGQLLSGTLMDYAVPKSIHVPRFELDRTVTPSPVNPLGVKGIGEAGTIGSTPVFVNAVVDALSPFGVKHIDMPLKPEKIWRACQAGKEGRRSK